MFKLSIRIHYVKTTLKIKQPLLAILQTNNYKITYPHFTLEQDTGIPDQNYRQIQICQLPFTLKILIVLVESKKIFGKSQIVLQSRQKKEKIVLQLNSPDETAQLCVSYDMFSSNHVSVNSSRLQQSMSAIQQSPIRRERSSSKVQQFSTDKKQRRVMDKTFYEIATLKHKLQKAQSMINQQKLKIVSLTQQNQRFMKHAQLEKQNKKNQFLRELRSRDQKNKSLFAQKQKLQNIVSALQQQKISAKIKQQQWKKLELKLKQQKEFDQKRRRQRDQQNERKFQQLLQEIRQIKIENQSLENNQGKLHTILKEKEVIISKQNQNMGTFYDLLNKRMAEIHTLRKEVQQRNNQIKAFKAKQIQMLNNAIKTKQTSVINFVQQYLC